MTHQGVRRLQEILKDKFWVLTAFGGGLTIGFDKTHKRWMSYCEGFGIKASHLSYRDLDDHMGHAFEEFVVVSDPSPGGTWLEMNRETALKILAIGLP